MLKQRTAGLLLAGLTVFWVRVFAAEGRDYSKEPFVIQDMGTKVSFAADGARDWRKVLSVRLQSEAAVRQFGVLSFAYSSESEKTEIEYVRVKKADGSVIETPAGAFLDVPGQVSSVAPMYTDTRQKQVPVKALGVGDVLEYAVHSTESKPEVAGQFWYSQPFINDSIVLKQSLEVRVLKDRYVQVASSTLKPEIHEDGAQRVYLWTHAQLNPAQASDQKVSPAKADVLKVELTSFRTWDEVGKWWQALASPQMTVTPELAAKAKELTAGLTTEAEKERAIYQFVALRFRYISISLGAGRYRPHSAAEVLANQYGDCKDKHVLFATLLKAAGIEAVPALIGEGMELRPDLPSPAQFNHVITAIPKDGGYVWADTTAEVAPFGMLQQSLRDEQALVIPAAGKAALVRTPIDPKIYARKDLHSKALRMWQLALASDKTDRNAQLQLQLAGLSHPALLDKEQGLKRPMSAGEQLSKMRSIPLPALRRQNASAEVFLLQSRTGVEDVRFINGSNPVNDADAAIRGAKPAFEFPDEGPERIVRRAIFYCSVFTDPSCSLTLLLPSATKLEPIQEEAKDIPAINGIKAISPVQEEAKDIPAIHGIKGTPPILVLKVEPHYTQAAIDAKTEGTVVLSLLVDSQGIPRNIAVKHSLGNGLDERAVECVSKWRFRPASKDGTPVITSATVEVSFRLTPDRR